MQFAGRIFAEKCSLPIETLIGPNPRSLWLEFNHNCGKHNEKIGNPIRECETMTTGEDV
jgi:hypothetical protein